MKGPTGIDFMFVVVEAIMLMLAVMDVASCDWVGATGFAGVLLIVLNLHNTLSR